MGQRAMKIVVTWEGIPEMLARLTEIGEKGAAGAAAQMKKLGEAAHEVMMGATHVRSGRLIEGNKLEVGGYSFRLYNETYYAAWVEYGHRKGGWAAHHDPGGWVAARPYLAPAVAFGTENILNYLSRSLENV